MSAFPCRPRDYSDVICRRRLCGGGIDSIIDALADHFAGRGAIYTWRELHRFVDACRSAFVLYETAYEIPSTGYRQRALTGVTYVHEGGRWLAIADQGSVLRP